VLAFVVVALAITVVNRDVEPGETAVPAGIFLFVVLGGSLSFLAFPFSILIYARVLDDRNKAPVYR
jgi:hypothetical protein